MRLLFLTSRLPWPPDRGDRLRTFNLLREFSQEHEISLVSFISKPEETILREHIKDYCKDIHLLHLPSWQSALSAVFNIWRGLPLQLEYYRSSKMDQLVDQLISREKFQAVYVHLFRMAPFVSQHPGIYRIIDLTDVISQEIATSLPYRSTISRMIYGTERPRIAAYESHVANWADETWLISDNDKLELGRQCGQANLQTIPNGVNLDEFFPKEIKARDSHLIFVGNLNVFHNIDAIKFLVQEILPLIREKKPDCKLYIVGAGESRIVSDLAQQPGVVLVGFVNELNDALNEAAIFVAPLRFSAGVQNKVLEAMAAGVPVVTTTNVNAGLGARPGKDLVVADDPQNITDQVIALLQDPEHCQMLRFNARRFVERQFSWQVAVERMRQIERDLT